MKLRRPGFALRAGAAVAAALVAALVVSAPLSAQATVPSSATYSFDSGLASWTAAGSATLTANTTTVHAGAGSIKCVVTAAAPADRCVSPEQLTGSITANTTLAISVWVNTPATSAQICAGGPASGDFLCYSRTVTANTWTQISANAILGSSQTSIKVGVGLGAAGTLYADDFTYSATPASQTGASTTDVVATPTPTPTPTASPSSTPTSTAGTGTGSTPAATQPVVCVNPCSVVMDGSQFSQLFPLLFGGFSVIILLLAILVVRSVD